MKTNKVISILLLFIIQPCFGMQKRVDPIYHSDLMALINAEKEYGTQDFSRLSDDTLKKTIVELQKLIRSEPDLNVFSMQIKMNKTELKQLAIDIIVRASEIYRNRVSGPRGEGLGPKVSFLQAATVGDLSAIKWYLEHNININSITPGKETALLLAVIKGHNRIITELIKAGANVNLANNFGYTPLHFAIMNKFFDIARELIKAGADVNAKDNAGMTPLMLAATRGYEPMVNSLISAGARVEEKDKNGKTALSYAESAGNSRIIQVLTDAKKWAKK